MLIIASPGGVWCVTMKIKVHSRNSWACGINVETEDLLRAFAQEGEGWWGGVRQYISYSTAIKDMLFKQFSLG